MNLPWPSLGRLFAAVGILFAASCTALPTMPRADSRPAARPLFDGKSLAGWSALVGNPLTRAKLTADQFAASQTKANETMRQHWRVENGELVSDGHGDNLCTDQAYGDFELWIDWKIQPRGDSGIYLRGSPQVQIWDPANPAEKANGADKGSGGLWNNSGPGKWPLVKADNPPGQWNRFYIRMVGARVTVKLNDKLVVDNAPLENYWDRARPIFPREQIELQTHGSEVRFRNILLREIPSEEANAILDSLDDQGFQPIFNGRDFSGWAGPVNEYQVKNGALMCRPGKGGTIHTTADYRDFEAKFEFKLPPAGNNGLAIRYPGQGDTAYVGMCELQILDDTAPQYKTLDPRQFCGSVYGIVPAQRGYLRPVGQWNHERVTVVGSTITVELNGTVILNADVSKAKDFLANHPHPGLTRTSGSFGFAGHNDPVEFRNIRLRELSR